ncbi:MAG: hypothetical protein MdMp014T_2186 [Treponematales bacterium]
MAITEEARQRYFEKIKPYKDALQTMAQREEAARKVLQGNPPDAALRRVALAEESLNMTSRHLIISALSQTVLKVRSEEALTDARNALCRGLAYLEETVSPYLDVPFSDYEAKVNQIAAVSAKQRYRLVRKMGLAVKLLENAHDDNPKLKRTFVEIEGRFACAAKNILDLKRAVANSDPRSPDYEPVVRHLQLVKKLLAQSADSYRMMYETSTHSIEDFTKGIRFLAALHRLHAVLGEPGETEIIKKKIDAWTAKLEADKKKQAAAP